MRMGLLEVETLEHGDNGTIRIGLKFSGAEVNDDSGQRLQDYYRLLDCSLIDITGTRVKDQCFDVIVDDEGLLKPAPVLSFLTSGNQPLVGNLLFSRFNPADGDESGLEPEDFPLIAGAVKDCVERFNQKSDQRFVYTLRTELPRHAKTAQRPAGRGR